MSYSVLIAFYCVNGLSAITFLSGFAIPAEWVYDCVDTKQVHNGKLCLHESHSVVVKVTNFQLHFSSHSCYGTDNSNKAVNVHSSLCLRSRSMYDIMCLMSRHMNSLQNMLSLNINLYPSQNEIIKHNICINYIVWRI